jgi:MOSC domain-containing protein YiiM
VRSAPSTVQWIGVRPARGAPMIAHDEVELVAARGIVGDRGFSKTARGKRQVTLIQAEHVPLLAAWLGRPVEPAQLRRNLVVAGINLLALVHQRFAIGDAILIGTGPCAPCVKLDAELGAGACQRMRGHGGITASIERGGRIRVGDPVALE